MKKLIIVVLMVMLSVSAYAAVNVKNSSGTVGKAETLKILGPSVTQSGTDIVVDLSTLTGDADIVGDLTVTGDVEIAGSMVLDGTLYTAKFTTDGAIYPGVATLDPCGTLGRGYIFFSNTGDPCYCNAAGVDVKLYDSTIACF